MVDKYEKKSPLSLHKHPAFYRFFLEKLWLFCNALKNAKWNLTCIFWQASFLTQGQRTCCKRVGIPKRSGLSAKYWRQCIIGEQNRNHPPVIFRKTTPAPAQQTTADAKKSDHTPRCFLFMLMWTEPRRKLEN